MPDAKTHTGGCHCGAVRYQATTDLAQVISCNCSICQARGLLPSFVPAAQFTLLSGQDKLRDYQFGKKRIHHLFCADCGVESFARDTAPKGADMVAINVRCLEGVDLAALTLTPFDGRKL